MISAKSRRGARGPRQATACGHRPNRRAHRPLRELGAALPGGVEHFGYADGFAQPSIEGSGAPPSPAREPSSQVVAGGRSAPASSSSVISTRRVSCRRAAAGGAEHERLLPGLPQAAPARRWFRASSPKPRKPTRAGKSCWRPRSSAAGATAHRSTSRLSAPTRPSRKTNAATTLSATAMMPTGGPCPVGAHVRRANPRNSLPFEGKLVNRHRLIRRGIPYGEPLPPGAPDDGHERGVIFMCLQASIARQFEFVQSQWFNGATRSAWARTRTCCSGPRTAWRPRQDDRSRRDPVPCTGRSRAS